MKGICKRLTAFLLSCAVLIVSILGRCQPVRAAAIAGPATAAGIAAGETLEFIYSALMSVGITLNLKELFGNRYDPDNWDWGDILDEPASQSDIDNLEKKIEEYYDNAVRDWYVNHGGQITPSPEPTKTPDTSSPAPVTPAPTSIPSDIGEKIDSWREMREKALQKKVLTMTAVAGACLKEAVAGWWDNIMDTEEEFSNSDNPYSYSDLVGRIDSVASYQGWNNVKETILVYRSSSRVSKLFVYKEECSGNNALYTYRVRQTYGAGIYFDLNCYQEITFPAGEKYSYVHKSLWQSYPSEFGNASNLEKCSSSFTSYLPYTLDGQQYPAEEKPRRKAVLLVNPDLKKALDDNKKSPDLPMPISITLPSLDELKDLVKDADDADDDDRPTIVQTFINNHTYDEPEPTQAPDPDPDPTSAPVPDPDPTGSPETTPSVTPATPGDIDIKPKPTTAPGTDTGGGGGTGTDPDTPDSDDVDVDAYKTDLRLVFPFCIPFDLIHLLEVLDADPEAPRFEIPVDIEVDNPFPRNGTESKMIDYETTIVIDMSDYEEPIKVIRIFEIIFFIIGLMLITRQHMIKG